MEKKKMKCPRCKERTNGSSTCSTCGHVFGSENKTQKIKTPKPDETSTYYQKKAEEQKPARKQLEKLLHKPVGWTWAKEAIYVIIGAIIIDILCVLIIPYNVIIASIDGFLGVYLMYSFMRHVTDDLRRIAINTAKPINHSEI